MVTIALLASPLEDPASGVGAMLGRDGAGRQSRDTGLIVVLLITAAALVVGLRVLLPAHALMLRPVLFLFRAFAVVLVLLLLVSVGLLAEPEAGQPATRVPGSSPGGPACRLAGRRRRSSDR